MSEKLKCCYAEKYQIIRFDKGSATKDITIFRPDIPEGSDYKILGDYAQSTQPDKERFGSCIIVKDKEGKFTKPPTDYIKLWDNTTSNNVKVHYTIWQPIAPTGYVALGFIVQKGTDKPPVDLVRCVDQKCVKPATHGQCFWNNLGSGSKQDINFWETSEVPKTIDHGLFTAVLTSNSSSAPPTSVKFWVLNKEYCRLTAWDLEIDHSKRVNDAFSKLFNDENTHDVVFVCEGKKIYAHKIIVASKSETLALELLKSGDGGKQVSEIEILKYPYSLFFEIMQYIYTGKFKIVEENVQKVLLCADYYKLNDLRDACFDFMVKSLDKDSVTATLQKAKRGEFDFDASSLVTKCIQFMQKKADQVIKTQGFLDLDEETIIEFCKDDKLSVDELNLFEAVQKWGNYQIKKFNKNITLKEQLKNVLRHIRYPLMTPKELTHIARPTGLVPDDLYLQAMEYFALPSAFEDSKSPQFRERHKLFTGTTLLNSIQCNLLIKWLGTPRRSWKLAYKATKDGWSSYDFHRLMDGKGENIVVIQSTNGYIFGGYTPISWASSGSYSYDPKSFLFSLVNGTGKPVKMENNASNKNSIYRSSSYGPTYGGGHDIYICNNPHNLSSSYTNLGYSYSLPGYVYGSTQIKNFLAGSYNFRVKEIEGFIVNKRIE